MAVVTASPTVRERVDLIAMPARRETARAVTIKSAVPPSRPPDAVPGPTITPATAVVSTRPKEVPPPWATASSGDDVVEALRRVPELSLLTADGTGRPTRDTWRDLEQRARSDKDRFVEDVLLTRADLAALPFRRGGECRLAPNRAAELDRSSRAVRRVLAMSQRNASAVGAARESEAWSQGPYTIYNTLVHNGDTAARPAPAVEQVLSGEPPVARRSLVQYLRGRPDSGLALARRAVYDPSEIVREDAVEALRGVAAEAYVNVLMDGLRHPWPRANYHAAEALVALNVTAAVPALVRELDAPDPSAPFETAKDGERFQAVREVVRVNHHANCLLCHAPSFAANDPVRGPVPSPFEPLPVLEQYYERLSTRGMSVRADVTYLRQDFSEVLPVDEPGPWPKEQRFDFLVRARRLAADEGGRPACGPPAPAPNHVAAAYALRQLTGLDGGYTAAGWEKVLADRAASAAKR